VITDGTGDIVATYGMFRAGPHAEILIDRQGYIPRDLERRGRRMPQTSAVQAQVRSSTRRRARALPRDHCTDETSCVKPEARHGAPGASRAMGGMGAISGPPTTIDELEGSA